MKTEVVQGICPAGVGNMDFTGTSPSGDMVGALFWGSAASANDTNSIQSRFSLGATDLTNNVAVCYGYANGSASAACLGSLSNTHCVLQQSGSGFVAVVAGYSSTLSNGVRLNASTVASGRLVNALLISGSDSAMKVGSQQFTGADTTKTITHGLGGTPDVIILLTGNGVNGSETGGPGVGVGFWDRQSASQSSINFYSTAAVNQANITAYASNATIAQLIASPSVVSATCTLTSIGSTTFNITLNTAAGSNTLFGWIALRGTAAQMFSKNVLTTLPTATGNTTLISGMSGRPQAVITIPTRLTAANTLTNSDAAGSLGVSVAATNNYSVTTQGAAAHTTKLGVATSVTANQISTTYAIASLDNTGAYDIQATVNSWDSGGMTPNYTNAGASAFEAAVLAFGLTSTQAPYIPRRTIRTISPVYIPQSF